MNEDTSSVNSEAIRESQELKVLKIFESRWNKVKYLANDLQKSIIEEYLREAENLVVSLSGLVASGREKRRDQKLFKDIISNTELQLGVLETNSVNGTKPIAKIEPIVPVTPDPIPTPEPKPVVIPPDLDPIVTPPAINNTNLNTPEPVFVVEPDPVTIPNIPTSLKQEVNEATSPAPVDIVEQLEKEYGRMQYIAKSLRHPRIKKIEQKLKELRVKAKEGVLDGELEGFKHSASILSRWINTLDRLYYIDEENENVQALIINRDRDQFLLRFGDATQMWVPISKVNDDNWPKEVRPPKVERVPKFDTSSLLEGQLNSMVASGNVRETIEEDLNPDSDTEFYALEKNIQMEEIWDKDTDDNLEPDEDLDTADLDESQLYAMMGTVEPVSDKDTVKVEDNFDTSALAQSQLDTMIANESAKTGDDLSGSLPIQKPRKPKRNKPTRKLAEDDINKNSNLNMKESVPKTITPNPEAVPDNIVGVENATPENTEGGDPVTNPENTGEVIDVVPDSVINKGEVKTGNQENIGQKEEDNRPQQNSDSKIIIPSFVGGRGPKVTGGADVTDLRNKILQMSPKNQDHIESKEKIGSQITEIKKQLDNLNSAEQKTTYRSKDFGQKFTEPVSFETGEAKKWLDDKNEELLQKLHNLEAEVKSFEKNKRKNEIKALLYELNKAVSQTSYHSKEFSEMFGVELPYETGQAKAWIENKVAELEAELDKLENNPPKNPESPKGPLPDDPLPERSVALETPISPEQPDLVPEESGQINPNGPSPINPDLDNAMETINSVYSGTYNSEAAPSTQNSDQTVENFNKHFFGGSSAETNTTNDQIPEASINDWAELKLEIKEKSRVFQEELRVYYKASWLRRGKLSLLGIGAVLSPELQTKKSELDNLIDRHLNVWGERKKERNNGELVLANEFVARVAFSTDRIMLKVQSEFLGLESKSKQGTFDSVMSKIAKHKWSIRGAQVVVWSAVGAGVALAAGAAAPAIAVAGATAGAAKAARIGVGVAGGMLGGGLGSKLASFFSGRNKDKAKTTGDHLVESSLSGDVSKDFVDLRKAFKSNRNYSEAIKEIRAKNLKAKFLKGRGKTMSSILGATLGGGGAFGISEALGGNEYLSNQIEKRFPSDNVEDSNNGSGNNDNETSNVSNPDKVEGEKNASGTEVISINEASQSFQENFNGDATEEVSSGEGDESIEKIDLENYTISSGETMTELSNKAELADVFKGLSESERDTIISNAMKSIDNTESLQDEIGLRSGDTDLIYAGDQMNLEVLKEVLEDQRAEWEVRQGIDSVNSSETVDASSTQASSENQTTITLEEQAEADRVADAIREQVDTIEALQTSVNRINEILPYDVVGLSEIVTDPNYANEVVKMGGAENFVEIYTNYLDYIQDKLYADEDFYRGEIAFNPAFEQALQGSTMGQLEALAMDLENGNATDIAGIRNQLEIYNVKPEVFYQLVGQIYGEASKAGFDFKAGSNVTVGEFMIKSFIDNRPDLELRYKL